MLSPSKDKSQTQVLRQFLSTDDDMPYDKNIHISSDGKSTTH